MSRKSQPSQLGADDALRFLISKVLGIISHLDGLLFSHMLLSHQPVVDC